MKQRSIWRQQSLGRQQSFWLFDLVRIFLDAVRRSRGQCRMPPCDDSEMATQRSCTGYGDDSAQQGYHSPLIHPQSHLCNRYYRRKRYRLGPSMRAGVAELCRLRTSWHFLPKTSCVIHRHRSMTFATACGHQVMICRRPELFRMFDSL